VNFFLPFAWRKQLACAVPELCAIAHPWRDESLFDSSPDHKALSTDDLLLLSSRMGPMRPERIPLFPLNVVLLPGGCLPLHIFKHRYRRMVRDCVGRSTEFGMLLSLTKGIVKVGCSAEVTEVCKTYPDGRMDILTTGRSPFRIVELLNAEEYRNDSLLEGQVDYLEDVEGEPTAQLRKNLIHLFEVCHTIVFGDYPRNLESGPGHLSYIVAGTLPMELLWKQQVLELRSEADRQERLVTYLREWAPHLQKAEATRRRSTGNGHGLN
jgi:Lon protease-like protein